MRNSLIKKKMSTQNFTSQVKIKGLNGRKVLNVDCSDALCNQIIYSHNVVVTQTVVYFPGDVQNFEDSMLAHRDNFRWSQYSLEKTADLLIEGFPTSLILVVRASVMRLNTFAGYQNFVQQTSYGDIEYLADTLKTLPRLHYILKYIFNEIGCSDALWELPIRIMGFSKGCVVLNQLVYELPLPTLDDTCLRHLISKLASLHWLDSGKPGQSGAWVCDENALKTLASTIGCIDIHYTPYQAYDKTRPWNSVERKKFVEFVRKHNGSLKETFHFKNEPALLENHFEILKQFLKVQDNT